MKLDPKAFLALDGTASAIIHAVWEPLAEAAVAEIAPLVEAGKFASAHDAINKIDMANLVAPQRKRLEELAVSALLFGAHRATGHLETTSYAQGKALLPPELGHALDQFDHAISHDCTEVLRRMLHQMVAAIAAGDQPQISLMKCDCACDEDYPDCDCGGVHLRARGIQPSPYQPVGRQDGRTPSGATLWEMRTSIADHLGTVVNPSPSSPVYDAPRFQLVTRPQYRPITTEAIQEEMLARYGDGASGLSVDAFLDTLPAAGEPDSVGCDLSDPVIARGSVNRLRESAVLRDGSYLNLIKEDAAGYTAKLYDATMNGGKSLIDVAATMTTSRIVSLGFLAEADRNGHETFQVDEVLDDKTCPVCRFMNGKRFDVAAELGRTLQALGTADPQDLKSIAPWPSQSKAGLAMLYSMSPADMQASGYGSPPYHPNCRGMLAAVEDQAQSQPADQKAPTLIGQAGQRAVDDVKEQTSDDFYVASEAGVDASELGLDTNERDLEEYIAAPLVDHLIISDPKLADAVGKLDPDNELLSEILSAYEAGDIELLRSLLDEAGISYSENQLYQA